MKSNQERGRQRERETDIDPVYVHFPLYSLVPSCNMIHTFHKFLARENMKERRKGMAAKSFLS